MRDVSRRSFLSLGSLGLTSLIVNACSSGAHASRDALPPTPQTADDDDAPPPSAAFCAVTADNIEGPFYKPGAPSRAVLVTDRDRGERLVLDGTVRGTDCQPLANAVLDIWHADARGAYDNDGWGLRGTLATDALGRWQLRTIVPGRYLNGRRYRPMHVHVKLRARGHAELTTQLYFSGDEYLEGDPFVVPSLIMQHRREGSLRRAAFDFVLAAA
jgi:protocatechuate 3,4-dioxygenase beta subunit